MLTSEVHKLVNVRKVRKVSLLEKKYQCPFSERVRCVCVCVRVCVCMLSYPSSREVEGSQVSELIQHSTETVYLISYHTLTELCWSYLNE